MLENDAILCSELCLLKNYTDSSITVSPNNKISLCTRIGEDNTVYMLLNESYVDTESEICIKNQGALYEVNLADNSLSLISDNTPCRFPTRFDGCGLKVFITEKKASVSGTVSSVSDAVSFVSGMENGRNKNRLCPVNWSVILPDKKKINLDGLNWPDWASLGWPEYSGFMNYTANFKLTCDIGKAILNIPGLHYHAIVSIDGKEIGKIAYKPYKLIISGLNKGRHCLEIKVYNTGANEVAGTVEAEKKRYSKRFAHMAAHDRKRLVSGITEPVTIDPLS